MKARIRRLMTCVIPENRPKKLARFSTACPPGLHLRQKGEVDEVLAEHGAKSEQEDQLEIAIAPDGSYRLLFRLAGFVSVTCLFGALASHFRKASDDYDEN